MPKNTVGPSASKATAPTASGMPSAPGAAGGIKPLSAPGGAGSQTFSPGFGLGLAQLAQPKVAPRGPTLQMGPPIKANPQGLQMANQQPAPMGGPAMAPPAGIGASAPLPMQQAPVPGMQPPLPLTGKVGSDRVPYQSGGGERAPTSQGYHPSGALGSIASAPFLNRRIKTAVLPWLVQGAKTLGPKLLGGAKAVTGTAARGGMALGSHAFHNPGQTIGTGVNAWMNYGSGKYQSQLAMNDPTGEKHPWMHTASGLASSALAVPQVRQYASNGGIVGHTINGLQALDAGRGLAMTATGSPSPTTDALAIGGYALANRYGGPRVSKALDDFTWGQSNPFGLKGSIASGNTAAALGNVAAIPPLAGFLGYGVSIPGQRMNLGQAAQDAGITTPEQVTQARQDPNSQFAKEEARISSPPFMTGVQNWGQDLSTLTQNLKATPAGIPGLRDEYVNKIRDYVEPKIRDNIVNPAINAVKPVANRARDWAYTGLLNHPEVKPTLDQIKDTSAKAQNMTDAAGRLLPKAEKLINDPMGTVVGSSGTPLLKMLGMDGDGGFLGNMDPKMKLMLLLGGAGMLGGGMGGGMGAMGLPLMLLLAGYMNRGQGGAGQGAGGGAGAAPVGNNGSESAPADTLTAPPAPIPSSPSAVQPTQSAPSAPASDPASTAVAAQKTGHARAWKLAALPSSSPLKAGLGGGAAGMKAPASTPLGKPSAPAPLPKPSLDTSRFMAGTPLAPSLNPGPRQYDNHVEAPPFTPGYVPPAEASWGEGPLPPEALPSVPASDPGLVPNPDMLPPPPTESQRNQRLWTDAGLLPDQSNFMNMPVPAGATEYPGGMGIPEQQQTWRPASPTIAAPPSPDPMMAKTALYGADGRDERGFTAEDKPWYWWSDATDLDRKAPGNTPGNRRFVEEWRGEPDWHSGLESLFGSLGSDEVGKKAQDRAWRQTDRQITNEPSQTIIDETFEGMDVPRSHPPMAMSTSDHVLQDAKPGLLAIPLMGLGGAAKGYMSGKPGGAKRHAIGGVSRGIGMLGGGVAGGAIGRHYGPDLGRPGMLAGAGLGMLGAGYLADKLMGPEEPADKQADILADIFGANIAFKRAGASCETDNKPDNEPDYSKRLEALMERRDPDGISREPVDVALRTAKKKLAGNVEGPVEFLTYDDIDAWKKRMQKCLFLDADMKPLSLPGKTAGLVDQIDELVASMETDGRDGSGLLDVHRSTMSGDPVGYRYRVNVGDWCQDPAPFVKLLGSKANVEVVDEAGWPDESWELIWPKKTAAALLPPVTIDRPKGHKKTFKTQAGPVESIYPVDYGYFNGVINPQDNEEADVFMGSGGARHGRYMKGKTLSGNWEPDEHKWYSGLTDDEHKAMMDFWGAQDPGLIQEHEEYPDIEALLASLPQKTAALPASPLKAGLGGGAAGMKAPSIGKPAAKPATPPLATPQPLNVSGLTSSTLADPSNNPGPRQYDNHVEAPPFTPGYVQPAESSWADGPLPPAPLPVQDPASGMGLMPDPSMTASSSDMQRNQRMWANAGLLPDESNLMTTPIPVGATSYPDGMTIPEQHQSWRPTKPAVAAPPSPDPMMAKTALDAIQTDKPGAKRRYVGDFELASGLPGKFPSMKAEQPLLDAMRIGGGKRLENTQVVYGGKVDPLEHAKRVYNNPHISSGRLSELDANGVDVTHLMDLEQVELGGPSYDPDADTVHMPWRAPEITLHELGHAIDFNSPADYKNRLMVSLAKKIRELRAARAIPGGTLWSEHAAWRKGRKAYLEGAAQLGHKPEDVKKLLGDVVDSKHHGLGTYWGNALGGAGAFAGGTLGAIGGLAGGHMANDGLGVRRGNDLRQLLPSLLGSLGLVGGIVGGDALGRGASSLIGKLLHHGAREREEKWVDKNYPKMLAKTAAAMLPPKSGIGPVTYVPRSAIGSVREHGLLSGKSLLSNPAALSAAASGRGETDEDFRAGVEKILGGWKPDSASGPNIMFQPPPTSMAFPDNHPMRKNDLAQVRVRLADILRDLPGTRVHGQELMPYDEYLTKWTPEQLDADQDDPSLRHRDLTSDEIDQYTNTAPEDLWSTYYEEDGKGRYAPNVPHAAVITPDGRIDPKYLDFGDEKQASTLYHGSSAELDEITPRPTRVLNQEPAVFATPN